MKFPKKVIAWAELTIKRSQQPYWSRPKVSPCKKYILKRIGIIIGNRPKLGVPTLEIGRYFLQPKVDRRGGRWKKAYNEITRKYCQDGNNYSIVGEDFHGGNVGYWKGKPVVFDW